jgi:AP-1 complex subunit beta-1
MNLIVQKFPELISNNIKVFFCKYTDPIYIKLEKLDLLVMLVSQFNVDQVLTEFKDYATEIDVEFVRRTVRGIGKIAVKLNSPESAAKCISVLLSLIEMKTNYVVQESVTVVRDIFRKYPTDYELIISALCENLESLDQPDAKASMIWILGEYADRIESCHEIIGSFLAYFSDEPAIVQIQLLTASVKLYLKSPSTGQDVVTEALRLATEETDNPDIRDRAYIYWRMLSSDPETTKLIVTGVKPSLRYEPNSLDHSVLDKLIEQLSLVSSIVHRQSRLFLKSSCPSGTSSPGDASDNAEYAQEYTERMEKIKHQTEAVERGEDIIGGDSSPTIAGPPTNTSNLIDLL